MKIVRIYGTVKLVQSRARTVKMYAASAAYESTAPPLAPEPFDLVCR